MTIEFEADISGTIAQLKKAGISSADMSRLLARSALMLETQIKANASGRPGPNAPTGNYRRSWNTRLTNTISGAIATVGTNAPQARRLEFGFSGTDALGRNYNQPPFPHLEPAIRTTEPKILEAIEQALLRTLQ